MRKSQFLIVFRNVWSISSDIMISAMRIQFQLSSFQEFAFSVKGKTYNYTDVKSLAQRNIPAAAIQDSIVEVADGSRVWLVVVGEEGQRSENGIHRGWYLAQVLDETTASTLIAAFKCFSGVQQ